MTPLETPEGEAQGQGAAIEAESSYTTLPIPIESLLEGQTSISVLLSDEELETVIACGEIGGVPGEGGSLVIKLSSATAPGSSASPSWRRATPERPARRSSWPASALSPKHESWPPPQPRKSTLEPIPEPTPTAEPVQVVDVALLEWLIDMPAETRAGSVNFVVTNDGAEAHSLVIESGGVVIAELPSPLDPGDSTILSVDLSPGEYVVYCPVDEGEHREQGMEATLLVVP